MADFPGGKFLVLLLLLNHVLVIPSCKKKHKGKPKRSRKRVIFRTRNYTTWVAPFNVLFVLHSCSFFFPPMKQTEKQGKVERREKKQGAVLLSHTHTLSLIIDTNGYYFLYALFSGSLWTNNVNIHNDRTEGTFWCLLLLLLSFINVLLLCKAPNKILAARCNVTVDHDC